MTALLVVVAVAFAYSMGAHYTGACMGMPHALGAISARRALAVMAPLTLVGAALASHGVERTVGHHLLVGPGLSTTGLVVVVGIAFVLTSAFNRARLPTSTIQILVFSVVGAGLAVGAGVHWSTIGVLGGVWVAAPVVAAGLGFVLTRAVDLMGVPRRGSQRLGPRPIPPGFPSGGAAAVVVPAGLPEAGPGSPEPGRVAAPAWLGGILITVGALASFAMGGNDVANATGSLVGARVMSPLAAGLVGGLGLAAGVLTWGRPLLRRVAFDIVTVDRSMATAAQLVQAMVVLAAVGFGLFTSMNQALVGAMSGAGAARGRHTVQVSTLLGIVRGWVVGPGAGLALAYLVTRAVGSAAGYHGGVGG